MSTRNSDVNLVIRARTEGEKAISGLGDILEALFDEARGGSQDIAELGKTIGALDKAAQQIVGSMDKAGAAVDRQRASIAESNVAYAALLRQQAEAQRVLAGFGDQANKSFVGPRTREFTEQYAGVRAEVTRLDSAIETLFSKITQQNAQLNGTQSSLLKLSATSGAVASAQAEAEARVELTTQALREQAAAAERVSDVQQRVNRLTGVDRPNATGRAADVADLLLAADAEFRRKEAADAEAAALRLVNNQLAERANLEATLERTTGLGRVRATDAGASFSALAERERTSEQLDRDAAALRATLNPLATTQERLNTSLVRYRELAAAGKITSLELAEAEQHLAAEAEKAAAALNGGGSGNRKITLFGLKPYELQNLSYQVNDVVTGLASGQHATQIIAQQGGQILQLFPRVAAQVIGALRNPAIAGLVVTVSAIALAMKEAADQADRLRTFGAATTIRADGVNYDPAALANAEQGLERIGAKAADAEKAVRTLLTKGINPDLLTQFARAAQETAEVLGTDLPTAAQTLADAFTGGFKAVADLDDKLNFLTASEREHIKALFDSGNAEAGRTEALNAYTRRADEAAAKQRGPWTDAARSLGNAWDALVKYIADSAPIQLTIAVLNELADAAKGVGDAITGALGGDAAATGSASNLGRVQAQIATLRQEIADYEATIAKGSPIAGTLQHLVDQSKQQLAAAEAQLAKLEKNAPDTVTDAAAEKKRAERLSAIDVEQQLQSLRQRGQAGLSAADSQRRAQLAGEIAYREEMKSTGDAIVAARLREVAVAKEQGDIDKANETARKSAAANREREIRQFESRVVGAEGGAGKNPESSAAGYGQFTEGTFLSQFGKVFPAESRSLGRDQILALRQNQQITAAIIDNFTRENARALESFGAKVTAGNLYLAHFLGAGGAKAVLTAPADRPVDQILQRLPRAAKMLSGNQGYLRTDGGRGRYRTSGELQAFIGNRVGDTGQAQTQGQVEIAQLIEDAQRKQDAFNQSVAHGVQDRQRSIDALRAEAGLTDAALLAEQRRQAVAAAELDLRQKAEDANKNLKPGESPVVVSPEQINVAKDLAAALFDAQHAKELLAAPSESLNRDLTALQEQRTLLVQQADLLRSIGEFKQADAVQSQVDAIDGQIQTIYGKLIDFFKSLTPEQAKVLGYTGQQLDNIIGKLEQTKGAAVDLNKELIAGSGITYKGFLGAFSSSAANAFTNFLKNVAAGKNVFKSFAQGIGEFAASFVSALAQMIIKTIAFTAALYALSAITHIPIKTLAQAATLAASVNHTGGIAGQAGGTKRNVPSSLFAAAMRYHSGGIVGLAPDEVPAVLKRGEEVLTEGDPRHRANGGGAPGTPGSAQTPVNIINVPDHDAAIQAAFRSRTGERVIMNFLSENRAAVKAALG